LQIERNRAGDMCRETKAVEYIYKSARRAKLINGQGEMQPKKCDEKYVHDGRIKRGKKKKKEMHFLGSIAQLEMCTETQSCFALY
jgi:hypothetical protein